MINGVEHVTQTELARSLTLTTPPLVLKPYPTKPVITRLGMSLVAFVVAAIIANAISATLASLLVIPLIVSWVLIIKAHQRAATAAAAAQQAAYRERVAHCCELYDTSYYCSRCDGWFGEGEPAIHAPSDMNWWLESLTEPAK